jgi:cystathionine gamma-synthase
MGGLVCGKKSLIESIFHFREINGASLQPMAAYLLARGMKTLELRVQRQNASALKIAEFLRGQPKVNEVFYPGLPTHPGHEFAKEQMSGFGGVLSFSLPGGFEKVKQFLPKLKIVHLAASLGSVSTLAGTPRTTSHVEASEEQRKQLGIPEGLIRYSVGIENVEDLIDDLETALSSI